ncbi:MAG: ATP-binding protein [Patescibacteria group bacterium]
MTIKMIKNELFKQKNDINSILNTSIIEREKTADAKNLVEKTLIKVVTGPRRSGKSTFCLLLLKGKSFAYANFDNAIIKGCKNHSKLEEALFSVYPNTKIVFLDEIQNLLDWELFVNGLQRRGYNIFLTGSNANLLSQELSTHLTGRFVEIKIMPFSFKEFLLAKEIDRGGLSPLLKDNFDDYLKSGGFPELVMQNLSPKVYLSSLIDSVILNDIVSRYKVRNPQEVRDLIFYLFSNFSSEFSYRKLQFSLGISSLHTTKKYVDFSVSAFLICVLNRYSHKVKEQIRSPKKAYLIDTGVADAQAFQFSYDYGKFLENMVFLELLRRGARPNFEVFSYKTDNNKEVDFYLNKRQLIQVCYDISDKKTKDREISALITAGKELLCNNLQILTYDQEGLETIGDKEISLTPVWKWLLT